MKEEVYIDWLALPFPPNSINAKSIKYENGALKVICSTLNESLVEFNVSFSHCLAYRVVQESGRLKSLDNSTLSSLCKTKDSDFITWFKEEGLGVYNDWIINHYVIVTLDYVIDILTTTEPETKII